MRRSLRENMRWKGSTKNWICSSARSVPLFLSSETRQDQMERTHRKVGRQDEHQANVVRGIGSLQRYPQY